MGRHPTHEPDQTGRANTRSPTTNMFLVFSPFLSFCLLFFACSRDENLHTKAPTLSSLSPEPVETQRSESVASTLPTHAPVASASASVSPRTATPSYPQMGWLAVPSSQTSTMFFSPQSTSIREQYPLTLVFHGMCGSAEEQCPFLSSSTTPHGWLLCTNGPNKCTGGGYSWEGSAAVQAKLADDSVNALRDAFKGQVGTTSGVLIGYSLGARAALTYLEQPNQHWSGLVLINSGAEPAVSTLKKTGIKRVAFIAGDLDATAGAMWTNAKNLRYQGIEAKYFSMGKVAHFFDDSCISRFVAPLSWVYEPVESNTQHLSAPSDSVHNSSNCDTNVVSRHTLTQFLGNLRPA